MKQEYIQQKWKAINELGKVELKIDDNKKWYISQVDVEIGGDGMLDGVFGRGDTIEQAINNHWIKLTEIPDGKYIVLNAVFDDRMHVKWNGFSWECLKNNRIK